MQNLLHYNLFLIILFALNISSITFSQTNPIPNYGFEDWAGGDPVGWQTSNSINQNSVTQSSDSQEGSFSAKLDRVGPTSYGNCGNSLYSVGVDADAFLTTGFPISKRYTSLKFYAKVDVATTPSCILWGMTLRLFNSQNQIAVGGIGQEMATSSNWSEWEAEIFYQQQLIPDSIEIIIVFNDTTTNSTSNVLIDNLRLVENIKITRPTSGMKWLAGSVDSIMWIGGESMNFVRLEFSQDEGNTFDFIDIVDADLGKYVWNIPETALTAKGLIRIFDIVDTLNADTSDILKVKGYQLTKLDGNGDYIPYDIFTDRWGFGNTSFEMWPFTWWQRFDYNGIDPFTGSQYQYSQWQGNFVFAKALSSDFPDWEAFVNTFTVDACYIDLSTGVYSPTALIKWDAKKHSWGGSCHGIAVSNSLAFSNKPDFVSKYPNYPLFNDPVTVFSDSNVIPVISELYTYQYGLLQNTNSILKYLFWNPNQTLLEIKSMLFEDDVEIQTLAIHNNNGPGGHAILPYLLEQDDLDKEFYYLYVYDNSYPNNTNALILIDTTGNSNKGSWLTTYGWNNWGGDSLIYLNVKSNQYLNNPALPKRSKNYISPFIMAGSDLEICSNVNANTRILDNQGKLTGFINGSVFNDIINSAPLIYQNGSETPPYGYALPTDNYSIQISEVESDTVETFFFIGNTSFSYERFNSNSNETDRLFFDGGVSAVNPDQLDRDITLVDIINESTQEKLYALRSVNLSQGDSVKIENINNDQLKLISYGSQKSYEVELNYAAETGLGRFGHSGIQLDMNTTHIYLPEWTNLSGSQLTVLVDNGNDGTIDDTLYLNNTVDVEENGNSYAPEDYRLEQNYPNPFNPITTIKYSIPEAGLVTLKVYNIIGEEIASLVNEEIQPGNYEVKFNAFALPSGIYFYKLQTENFVETKKMILIK